ncbi:zona pellucida protein C [Triplophysa rosa]|uniref:Zona pellucida protein C n=1 Tax=Triplophysa rosa TaxID=992332 RepID=A0A9W7WJR7_TRIRA|nr:zona pellucida protein C [Triplophysa rosa]KAI7804512.1 zona pellucida protein C precursor [Triplophysa rosa]
MMGVTAAVVFCCCIIASVTSNGDDFNVVVSSYSPGVVQDIRHVPDFPVITEDRYFLNEILQPPTSDQLKSVFPMPNEVQALLERSSFSIRTLNPSWNNLVNTNVFHKGEQLYVQVSASPGPGQQLYVKSCHASASPNPSDKPKVAFIFNKGCVASKKSFVKFVHRQSDRVILVLGTSSLKSSEVYLHCRVSLSYLGLTPNTKFCNYNRLESRWVDLSGQTALCQCCGRSCRSLGEREDLLGLSAVVSTGLLFIKEQQSEPWATPLAVSNQYSTTKPSPAVKTLSDNRWIVAGASFSGNPIQNMANISPWPAPPGFGSGVMVISQGLGGALSMWLPDLAELQFNPMVEVGVGYPEHPPVVDITLQSDDPHRGPKLEEEFEKWQMEQDQVKKPQQKMPEVGEGKAYFEAVGPYDVAEDLAMWKLKDGAQLYKVQGEPFVGTNVQLEQPKLNEPSPISDLQTRDLSFLGTSPSPDKATNGTEDEGEVFVRQAELVFKKGEDETLSEPLHYSKLSLNRAPDGSSSLFYEEQKRSSTRKQGTKKPLQELDALKLQKDEEVFGVKDLISILLDRLSELWH